MGQGQEVTDKESLEMGIPDNSEQSRERKPPCCMSPHASSLAGHGGPLVSSASALPLRCHFSSPL